MAQEVFNTPFPYLPVFSQSDTLVGPVAGQRRILWTSDRVCKLVRIRVKRTGGTDATINVFKNGDTKHLAIDLQLENESFYAATVADLYNVDYAPGEYLEIEVVTIAGVPVEITFQVEFETISVPAVPLPVHPAVADYVAPDPPSVTIDAPANLDSLTGTVDVEGTVTLGSSEELLRVEIWIGGAYVGDATLTDLAYTLSVDTTDFADGGHTIVAKAIDGNSLEGTAYITVTIANGGGGGYTDEMAQDAVGGILTPTASVTPNYDDATPEITFDVNDNTTVQKVAVRKNSTGGDVGTRRRINLIEGTGVTITIIDDAGDDEIDVTIDAAAGSYTDEQAQDAVGTILDDTATIQPTYDDVTPNITFDVKDSSITFAKMQNINSDRLIGRDTAGVGSPEAIIVGGGVEFSGGAAIQRSALTGDVTALAGASATTIAPNAVTTAKIVNDAVTFPKIQNMSNSSRLLGRGGGGGTGDVEEIALGTGLSMSTTTLNAAQYLTWTEVTGTSQAMVANNAYIANNAALVTLTLPTSANVGDRMIVVGLGAGLWKIAQNSGQAIRFANGLQTTSGVTGYAQADWQYSSIELVCIGVTATPSWAVMTAIGAISINTGEEVASVRRVALDFALQGTVSATASSDQNDYAPSGHATAVMFRLNITSAMSITGLAGGYDGRVVIIANRGTALLKLTNESGSSTAANRFTLPGDQVVPDNGSLILRYSGADSRWRLAAGGQTLSTKGDIGVMTADYIDRLPVGSNGFHLTADSTDSTFGVNWQRAWTLVAKTANQDKISDSTLANDSALSFTVTSSGMYRIQGRINFDTTAAADFKFGITAPTALKVRGFRTQCVPAGTPTIQAMETSFPASVSLTGTGTTNGYIEFDYVYHADSGGGTWAFQWAQNTLTAANTTVLAGSYIQYMRVA